MGRLSLLAVLIVVWCSFVSSIIPPPPIRRIQKSFPPLKKPITKGKAYVTSWTSPQCKVMRPFRLVRKTNMPFLCHVVTQSVMPRPRHRDPMASARMMMMMKANGWLPCYKSVPVTIYKMKKVPVCCPGTIPTPIGACMVRTPVPTPQLANRKRLSPGQLLLSKTKAFGPQPRQPTKGRTGTPSRKLPLPARRPVFWKTPRPSRGMMSPKKPVGLRVPPPALLRMLSSRTGAPSSRATSNRNQKASPVKVKSRPTFPMPKPLPPSSIMLPLLTSLMLKSQSTKPSFKRQPPKPQTRPSPPVFHKRPPVPLVKSLPAKPLMKPIPPKLVSKAPPMGPLFGPGPAGPLFQIVMSMLNRVRHLPTKPVATGSNPTPGPMQSPPASHSIGPFPRALVDDFLFSPEPLTTGSTVKPLLKDFLDDLLFSSVFSPNFPGPLPKFGAGDRFSNVPFPFMNPSPLSNIPPPLLNMRPWSDSHFPLMNAGPLSMFRPPFIPAALLSSLLAPEVVPKPYAYPRPPTIPNLNARSPVMPPSFLSDLRPPMMAKSSPANIQHPQRPDLLSKVRPPMMPLGLLPNSRSPMVVNGPLTNLPPPAFSAGSVTKARPPVRPADSQSGQEPQVKAPQSQQAAPEKTKSSELSEWQKEVARYLATMMYHKLQVEQQHKKLLTEVSRQNSLSRQMELLLTQQIIQTYQREQQRKQKEEEQQQQQQQQQQKQLQQQQIIQQQQKLLLQQQQQQQLQQQQQQQQQEEDAGSQHEDVSFQLNPSLPPQTVTVPPMSFQEESTTPVMHQPGLSEVVQEDPYAEPVGDKLLPLVRGILDEIPQPRPPLFAAASLPPGLEEMQTEMAEVKQKVRTLVNDCLARSNLSVTMEQVLQSGEPGNLRPICRKSNTVGPCVLAQTQDVMGQDHMGMTGRQLVQSVLMALGQACAKLEEGEHLMDSTDSDVTSTAVFPNPPPEMIQEVATEVPMAEPEGDSPMLAPTTSDVAVAPPEEPSVTVEKATPLPPKIPEVGQDAHVDKEPEVTPETEITLPLWMILVIVSTCAGILLFTGVCVCLVWRHRRKGTADVIDREPEKLPVPATVNMALPPPAYPQAGEGLGEDVNFKIPEDTENRQRIG